MPDKEPTPALDKENAEGSRQSVDEALRNRERARETPAAEADEAKGEERPAGGDRA